jgi:F0F1-type ATP synthase membrane subunit c/vacuolar-type H+-ATPase subunit K
MVKVLEDASTVAANIVVGKMHAAVARKAVEAVAMEAAMAALCAMRNNLGMVLLEAVAMEAARNAVRKLRRRRRAPGLGRGADVR